MTLLINSICQSVKNQIFNKCVKIQRKGEKENKGRGENWNSELWKMGKRVKGKKNRKREIRNMGKGVLG